MLKCVLCLVLLTILGSAEANGAIELECNANGTIIRGIKSALPFNVSISETVAVWHTPIQTEDDITVDNCLDKFSDPEQFIFEFRAHDCEPLVTQNKTHISKTYRIFRVPSVRFEPGQETSRAIVDVAWYTCTFEKTKVCTSVDLQYALKNITIEVPGDPGINDVLTITMALYTNDSYTELLSGIPLTVSSPDFLYLGIKLESGPDTLIVEVTSCWSTPTSRQVHPHAFYMLENGVVATDQFDGGPVVEVLKNNVDKEFQIKFRVFAWRNFTIIRPHQRTFFHCDISICDSAIDLCGGGRRKRDVDKQNQISSLGPVIIQSGSDVYPDHKCTEDNECTQICRIIEDKEICSCEKGFLLADDQKSCIKYSLWSYHPSTGIMISGFHLDAAVGIFVLFLVFATLIILAKCINSLVGRNRKNENPKA